MIKQILDSSPRMSFYLRTQWNENNQFFVKKTNLLKHLNSCSAALVEQHCYAMSPSFMLHEMDRADVLTTVIIITLTNPCYNCMQTTKTNLHDEV
jgi:Tfp pilus assembly protein PilV